MRMRDLGEHEALRKLIKLMRNVHPGEKEGLPLGDDASMIPGTGLLVSIDGYSATYSRYPWEKWSVWGWRATVASMSDIVAKGGRPLGVVVSLGFPGDTDYSIVEDVMRGVKEALLAHNAWFLGGDLNSSERETWIDIASVGMLETSRPLARKGAEPGNLVFTTLVNGYGLPGLIQHAYYGGKLKELEKSLGGLPEYTPRLPLDFPKLASRVKITSSIDVSDGLLRSLWILALENSVTISIEKLPEDESLRELAEALGLSIEKCVLEGGEEYEVIFTVDENDESSVQKACEELGFKCFLLGRVTGRGASVEVIGREARMAGWDQFRSTSSLTR